MPEAQPAETHRWQSQLQECTRTALQSVVRAEVEVSGCDVVPARAAGICRSAEPHAWFTLWRGPGEAQEMLLELSPGLLLPVVARMLGGRLEEAVPPRGLTEIEQRLARRAHQVLAQALLTAYRQTCQRDLPLTLAASGAAVEPADCPLVGYRLQLQFAGQRGALLWGLPLPLVRELERGPAVVAAETEAPATSSDRAAQTLSVTLARLRLSADQLATLAAGDVLSTGQSPDVSATVEIDGQPRFVGRPGTVDGEKAVEITAPHPGD